MIAVISMVGDDDHLGLRRRGRANEAVAVLDEILHACDHVRVPGYGHGHKKRTVESRVPTTNDHELKHLCFLCVFDNYNYNNVNDKDNNC